MAMTGIDELKARLEKRKLTASMTPVSELSLDDVIEADLN